LSGHLQGENWSFQRKKKRKKHKVVFFLLLERGLMKVVRVEQSTIAAAREAARWPHLALCLFFTTTDTFHTTICFSG